MPSYLDAIVAAHRASSAARPADFALLEAEAAARPPARGFAQALSKANRSGSIGVIAEVKRRSPSRGDLAPGLEPALLAASYARGGASCLSVLTDEEFFGGSAADLREARAAVALPVLRKDFTVSAADLYEAAAMGADSVLLIVAALSDEELGAFVALAERLGCDALVEVHDEEEAKRALRAEARIVGVNQRDLRTFEVDEERAVRVGALLPEEIVRVAESGVHDRRAVLRLEEAGFDAVLVGEALVTAPDPAAAVADLLGAPLPLSSAG